MATSVDGALLKVDGVRRVNLNKSKEWHPDPRNPNVFYVDEHRFEHSGPVSAIAADLDLAMQNAGGGGGGGGAVTATDGAINTLGARAHAPATDPAATTDSLMSVLKGFWQSSRPQVTGNYPSSATITTGGTAQQALAANTARRCVEIQNNSTGDIWFRFGAASAIGTGFRLKPDQTYQTPPNACPTGLLSIIGATTGQAYSVGEL